MHLRVSPNSPLGRQANKLDQVTTYIVWVSAGPAGGRKEIFPKGGAGPAGMYWQGTGEFYGTGPRGCWN